MHLDTAVKKQRVWISIQPPTCLCTVYFQAWTVQAKNLLLTHFWAVETGKIHPHLTHPCFGTSWTPLNANCGYLKETSFSWEKTLTLSSPTVRFLLFAIRHRLRSHFKNSCFVFYRGFQTLENTKSSRPNGLGLSSVFSCLESNRTELFIPSPAEVKANT